MRIRTGLLKHPMSVLTLCVLIFLSLYPTVPVAAVDRSDKPLVVSKDQRETEQTYPRMPAVYPRQNPAQAGSAGRTRSVARCRSAAILWCDAIPVKINLPQDTLYRLLIILTWPGPDAKDSDGKVIKDSEGRTQKPENDLDLYLRDLRTTTITFKDGTTDTEEADLEIFVSASIWHPEFGAFGDLPPNGVEVEVPVEDPAEEAKRTESHEYWVTPVNFNGSNQGYTLKAIVRLVDEGLGQYEDPEEGFKFDFDETPASGTTSLGTGSDVTAAPTLAPVKTPGLDGPIEERQLSAIKAQEVQQARRRGNSLIVGVIALFILGIGIGTFFFIRSRRSPATASL